MLISVGERSRARWPRWRSRPRCEAISLTGSQAGIVRYHAHGKAKIVDVRAGGSTRRWTKKSSSSPASGRLHEPGHHHPGARRLRHDGVALAAALSASHCEIYTDVAGVFSADPRVVPNARKLHAVSYDEMLELAASGAKVLQLRSVEVARNYGVKLHVRSTFSDDDGTWVTEEDERMLERRSSPALRTRSTRPSTACGRSTEPTSSPRSPTPE
jgi:aspartate kinase